MGTRGPRSFQRVLITGIAGSGGSYLAEYIVDNHPGTDVHGLARWHSTTQNNFGRLDGRVTVHEADLMDLGSTIAALRQIRPDAIFHLASHANVRVSFLTPGPVLGNNIIGTSNLFEAVRLAELDPMIQLCSTSEVYGQVDPNDVPITEEAPLQPASPYAVSKVAQDLLGRTYFVSYGMRIIRTRMFAYINPRRADLFASSFARQITRVEQGLQSELLHGNLDSVRTLIDVRDAMRAYWEALIHCEPGEVYNIGGLSTMTVGEVLDRLLAMATVPVPIRQSSRLLRPADVTLQIPSVEKFVKATGWVPRYGVEESLRDLLEYWRREAAMEARDRPSSEKRSLSDLS